MAHTVPIPEAVDATTGQVHHFTPVQVPDVPVAASVEYGQATTASAVQQQIYQQQHVQQQQTQHTQQQQQQQPQSQAPTHQPTPTRPQPRRVPTAVITRPGEEIPPAAETETHSRDLPPSAVSHTVHVPNTANSGYHDNQTSVVPATAADSAPDHALPTAPTVHPEAQAAELDAVGERDPGLVAAQVEKSKGDRRELKGLEPKGTVVQGIEDDKLWALMRRFDVVRPFRSPHRRVHASWTELDPPPPSTVQQVNHTLILTSQKHLPPYEPDLRRSVLPHVPFNSDILKANMERLYAGAGVGLIRATNEIIRLRSWRPEERRRTAYFCGTYFFAWCLGLAIPTLILFLITLTVLPESRAWFFPTILPPAGQPPSATDPTNQAGDQSFLGGVDSAVQHRSKAEQIEEQAWEFRQLAEAFAVRIAVSKGAKTKGQGNAQVGEKRSARSIEGSSSSSETDFDNDDFADAYDVHEPVVDADDIDPSLYAPGEHPSELARQRRQLRGDRSSDTQQGMKGKTTGTGKTDSRGRQVARRPMSEKERKHAEGKDAKAKRDAVIGKYTKIMQDVTGDMADLSECLANALSPPRPYPPNIARFKLAGAILGPLFILTAIVPAWIWHRAMSFLLGAAFFGQPLIDRGLAWFVKAVPDWKEKLDLRNSLLSGVPTNDQLVLHLLRVGERMNHPIPRPPPPPLAGSPKEAIKDTGPDPDSELVDDAGNAIDVDDLSTKDKIAHKSKSKLVNSFKAVSKRVAAIGADVTVDGVRKKVGTKVDRVIFGDVLADDAYPCKLRSKPGHIIIRPMSAYGPATLVFEPLVGPPVFERAIDDIVEVKKGGVSMPRAVLGWASGADIESQTLIVRLKNEFEKQVSEIAEDVKGMQVQDGDIYELNQVVRREQLFNRLISMGNQRWESL
ncbi:hypothetical protein QFC21_005362 [Naganishia friedmannii]|uniref:Uncharacterized protein n=1 Tax=Naganishia friedmannii TaxID=89922 RepID=A0ACC2VAI8_9TREE|nr:hypothetical protein QFC21_005362 [Naganishia friedmannii]